MGEIKEDGIFIYRPPILTYQFISDKNIVSSLKNLKKLLKSKEFLPIKRKPI